MIENMGSMDIVLCLGLDVVFTHNTVCQYTIGPVSLSVHSTFNFPNSAILAIPHFLIVSTCMHD